MSILHHDVGTDVRPFQLEVPEAELADLRRRVGHFAAWEEPELFSTEVRAAFRSLR